MHFKRLWFRKSHGFLHSKKKKKHYVCWFMGESVINGERGMFSTSCYLLWENFTGSYLVTEKYEKMVNKKN